MAGKGAYYAAAGAANQVQPVSFGDIAMGFANIAESKRKESAEQAKYRQDFLMKQQELFGDEIAGEFDGTGIDNLDSVGTKLKTSIKNHAEILNSLYEEGKISESQLNSRMRKLSNASSQFRALPTKAASFIEKDSELGGNSSSYNDKVLEMLEKFSGDMLPVIDENSDLVLLTRNAENGLERASLSGMENLLSAKQGVKDSDIFKGVMAGIKPTTQVRGKAVVSTYMPDGELSTNTKNYLNEQFDIMSDDQLIDLAIKNDIDYGSGLDIKDKEALKKNLMGVYEEKTKDYLTDQEAADEVRGISLAIQQGNFEMAQARDKRASDKDEEAKRTMLPPENTVVKYELNGIEDNYAAKVWQTPINKSYNIAPLLGKKTTLTHVGAVQLTQLQQINVGTAENPIYKYRASVYMPPSKGKMDDATSSLVVAEVQSMMQQNKPQEEIDRYIQNMTKATGGASARYDTIDLTEENLKKLQKYLPADFIEQEGNYNYIFQPQNTGNE
jgi:hypothetical protein